MITKPVRVYATFENIICVVISSNGERAQKFPFISVYLDIRT